ncbi:aspartate kinase [Oscillibacter sp. MSJ-2]|uniref:Aspartokinase n=1 Tax=Dysosmobacter acutus TaxID=2841504 RepID=A0ABS6F5T4_9FIRM|nr:aspartate kinase [Dysosmobacter acutus]MBU5625658.1 aspartate kinase [Dysosmobacter acutus]
MKTVKFGGSSLATAAQFEKVGAILRQDPERRYVVASAPGKRFSGDIKVTDLLYCCYDLALEGKDFAGPFTEIRARFDEIITRLHLDFSLEKDLDEIEKQLRERPQRDFAASRGEYLNSRVMAAYLDVPFLDAAECVFFTAKGAFDAERTNSVLGAKLKELPRAVVPGFYGALPDGTIRTFSRGGSDITGAIVARASQSDVYENWTDVSGMLVTDPRIVPDPKPIGVITYTELRELAYMGASVLHEDAIFPVKTAGIPINIRNTNRPQDPGTLIVPQAQEQPEGSITGVAGRKGFTVLTVEKDQMNSEVGFGRKMLSALEECGVNFEHMPSGIDTLSVVMASAEFEPHRQEIVQKICSTVNPDAVSVEAAMAMIAVVGRGMVRQKGLAARLFTAIAEADVNLRMIDQGSSELNIIIGVDEADFEKAISAVYHAFCV